MAAYHLNHFMRKPDFCMCKNKAADQLCSNCAADQRHCFCYTDSTIPLLHNFEILSFCSSSVATQPILCQTWSQTREDRFSHLRPCVPGCTHINGNSFVKPSRFVHENISTAFILLSLIQGDHEMTIAFSMDVKHQIKTQFEVTRPRGCKTFFMLNSAETEIYPAHGI